MSFTGEKLSRKNFFPLFLFMNGILYKSLYFINLFKIRQDLYNTIFLNNSFVIQIFYKNNQTIFLIGPNLVKKYTHVYL